MSLQDKFRGCIAGSWVASAMGAAVEGWTREKIRDTYGTLDRLVSYKHYTDWSDWQRLPGTTEDGIERQKLIASAIIEKQDRILADDLVRVWLRDLQPERMRFKQEPFDCTLLDMVRAGTPAADLGRMWPWPGIISVARASHPLGLINAGDPRGAADDSYEVGKLYIPETAFGLRWAGLYNAAIAQACRPDATVDSVLATAREYATYRQHNARIFERYDTVLPEVERAIAIGRACTTAEQLMDEMYKHYWGGYYIPYHISQANEIVAKGLAIFAMTRGDPRGAIVTAVNFGRDTDCLAAIAGGLAGAFAGLSGVPAEWVRQVNDATRQDPYTNNQRTIEQTADALLEAFRARLRRLADYAQTMDRG